MKKASEAACERDSSARAVKFLLMDYSISSRDRREVQVIHDMGFDTVVYSKGDEASTRVSDGIVYIEEPTLKKHRNNKLNHLGSARHRLSVLRKMDCEVISCHDIHALLIGWLSTVGKSRKPALVYDAHEFEVGRNVGGNSRKARTNKLIGRLEKFLMRRCAFTIAVNDSIADEMVKVHELPQSMRPIVVRSTPSLWQYDESAVARNREMFCRKLGIDSDDAFIAMYHGIVMRGRGIEQALEAVSKVEGCSLVVLGNGDRSYIEELEQLARRLGIERRVLFHPAVSREVLESHVACADVGLVVIQGVAKSYYFALPNKLFENIQAEVPVIASSYPELVRIVNGYEIGMTVDPHDTNQIAECIRAMSEDRDLREFFKANLRKAKKELCWENERSVLEAAYGNIVTNEVD